VGIPSGRLGVVSEPMIGTAGFPFPWKRPDLAAEVAKQKGMKFRFIAPRSDQMNTDAFVDGICGHLGTLCELYRGWIAKEEVVTMLSTCTLNIFWYQSQCFEDQLGQSGSVRMGVGAGRPLIISRHRKMRTLFPYEDELYICGTEADVWKAADEILADPEKAKRPNRVLKDMGWERTGQMLRDLVHGLFRK
jgi:hypothetical protein